MPGKNNQLAVKGQGIPPATEFATCLQQGGGHQRPQHLFWEDYRPKNQLWHTQKDTLTLLFPPAVYGDFITFQEINVPSYLWRDDDFNSNKLYI